MNNKNRKDVITIINNKIFLYNLHAKKYVYYKGKNGVRVSAASSHCDKYLCSIRSMLELLKICDSKYNYSLCFESHDFYSPCSLVVEKVEG